MRILIVILLCIATIGIGAQVYFLAGEKNILQANLAEITSKLESMQKENSNLKTEIEYFTKPENLEKELRSRFNLKQPVEKTIIIVPKNETSSPNESNN